MMSDYTGMSYTVSYNDVRLHCHFLYCLIQLCQITLQFLILCHTLISDYTAMSYTVSYNDVRLTRHCHILYHTTMPDENTMPYTIPYHDISLQYNVLNYTIQLYHITMQCIILYNSYHLRLHCNVLCYKIA